MVRPDHVLLDRHEPPGAPPLMRESFGGRKTRQMSRNVYFVTHPDVVIDPATPVPQWPHSDRGRSRMRRFLGQAWMPHVAALYCSTEQKAIDGAAILADALGMSFHPVAALGENDRSATGYLPQREFEATVDAFFARLTECVRGWERALDAQARIIEAVEQIVSLAPGTGSIVAVSHGGVGALLLCHLKGVPISRTEEQPGAAGGNYFLFQMPTSTLVHTWKAIDA